MANGGSFIQSNEFMTKFLEIHELAVRTEERAKRLDEKLEDRLKILEEMKPKVERADKVISFGKYLGVPALSILHIGLKHLFNKL
jgi:phage antirepressor YoqD-like protein